MPGFPTPFGGGDDDDLFTEQGVYDAENMPDPGAFLADEDLLTGEDHVAFHDLTRDLFEERGVYDMTFGYNLAQLNRDTRHPNAGYRYAQDADDPAVLRAEFTPTTAFCPQSDTLTTGSFRAWNGLSERHEYDLVRVRVAEMHHHSQQINDRLREMEEAYEETGAVPEASGPGDSAQAGAWTASDERDQSQSGGDAPF